MTIGSLFSGIGGFELGLESAGLGPTLWQVEKDEFCRSVLARHWPEAKRYDDVCAVGAAQLAPVDLICGGFPCQPVSVAGKRRAQRDERRLWPHFRRVIEELRPKFVLIENVPGLRSAGLRDVLADLAAVGFDAEWSCVSASDVGAPHQRRRIFVVATDSERVVVRQQPGWLGRAFGAKRAPVDRDVAAALVAADPDGVRRLEQAVRFAEERGWAGHCGWRLGSLARVDDGIPRGILGSRRKSLGNAVVPQYAEVIGWVVRELMEQTP